MSTYLDFLQQTEINTVYAPFVSSADNNTNLFHQNENAVVSNPYDIPIAEVTVRHLKTMTDIQEIQYLRGEINLASHRMIDPRFIEHEKKEIN